MVEIDRERIGRDLWPKHRKSLIRKALRAAEGQCVRLSIGEAETLARAEVDREVNARLRNHAVLGI